MVTAHTSRESLGVGVFVPSPVTWESEEANVVLAGPEDFVGTEELHVAEWKFAEGMSVVRARQMRTVNADVPSGMPVLAGTSVGHTGRDQGLSGVSGAIHASAYVNWRWNQARKGGTRCVTGHVSVPIVKRRIRFKDCDTKTHIDSISVFVYPHAVYNRVETTA